MLGFDREANVTNLGDSAEVFAYIYDNEEKPISVNDLLAVDFTIQKPDMTKDIFSGEITGDGTGYIRYTDTDLKGQYVAVAQFTFIDGGKRSSKADFEVVDPFEEDPITDLEVLRDEVWKRLEDCFDSEDEGPWLRDWTNNTFTKDKMTRFLNDALFDINHQHPPTSVDASLFLTAGPNDSRPDLPVLAQGVFMNVLRHLMRSYTEQPTPTGANIAYEDRRDYLQRWATVYQIEMQTYQRWLALWKRQFLGLGQVKTLVSTKAGRLLPAPMRTRSVGRGYW